MYSFIGLLSWPLMAVSVYLGYARSNWIWAIPLLGLCALAITLFIKPRALEVVSRDGLKAFLLLWATSSILPALLFGAGFLAALFLNH